MSGQAADRPTAPRAGTPPPAPEPAGRPAAGTPETPSQAAEGAALLGAIRRHGSVAAIGEPAVVGGFALVGVRVCSATTPEQAHRAWAHLPDTVTLVILSPTARGALEREIRHGSRLTVTVPT